MIAAELPVLGLFVGGLLTSASGHVAYGMSAGILAGALLQHRVRTDRANSTLTQSQGLETPTV
jgi:hypothetical protein